MGMISMNIIRRASVFTAATAMGALVIFAASGCGGARTAVTTNGLEKKTGAQVARDAAGAIEAAKSVHVKGVIFGPRYRFDVRIQGADRAGSAPRRAVAEGPPGGWRQPGGLRLFPSGFRHRAGHVLQPA